MCTSYYPVWILKLKNDSHGWCHNKSTITLQQAFIGGF